MTSRGAFRVELLRVLRGRRLDGFNGWRLEFQLIRYAAGAFEIPSLALGTVPA